MNNGHFLDSREDMMKNFYRGATYFFSLCVAGSFVFFVMFLLADAGVEVPREYFGETPSRLYLLALVGIVACWLLARACDWGVKILTPPPNRYKPGRRFDPPPEPEYFNEVENPLSVIWATVSEEEYLRDNNPAA